MFEDWLKNLIIYFVDSYFSDFFLEILENQRQEILLDNRSDHLLREKILNFYFYINFIPKLPKNFLNKT